MALSLLLALNEMPIAYAIPSLPIETQGSDARSYGSPPGAQLLNGSACCEPHVAPPSNDAVAINACAPPFDERSCCQTAIWLAAPVGLTALNGSTSVFGNTVPPAAGVSHAATGLGLTDTTEVKAASAAVAAASATTVRLQGMQSRE